METHTRTILKTLTWRVTALIITTLVTLAITRRLEAALTVGAVDTIIKLGAYYYHERCWLKVSFGRLRPPDYEI